MGEESDTTLEQHLGTISAEAQGEVANSRNCVWLCKI